MTDLMSGPCVLCGAVNYPLSMGGPTICPSCDCGDLGLAKVQRQAKEIERLRLEVLAMGKEIERLREALRIIWVAHQDNDALRRTFLELGLRTEKKP